MSNKLLLSDITDLLSENAKISKKEAGAFLKVLFELVEEQLLIEKIVKIKGLGTFKLIWVESRRIANVNTGEIQEISGHYKPTFTPDAALAEAVNEPFAHLETMDLDDSSVADEPIAQKIEENHLNPSKIEPVLEEEVRPVLTTIHEDKTETEGEQESVEEETAPRKRSYKTLIFLILFVLLVGTGYYGSQFWETFQPKPSQKIAADSIKSTPMDTTHLKADSVAVGNAKPASVSERKDSILTTEMMEAGSRLTRVALKYYGNKVFWVYLYQANKYVISNPNHVTAGTVLEIPNKEIYNIDANDPQSIATAKALESEIKKQFD
ncbi:MAG: HU family DNA-binding protein [Bacteroidales bacterium]